MRSHHVSGVAPFDDLSLRVVSVLTQKGCGAISDDPDVQACAGLIRPCCGAPRRIGRRVRRGSCTQQSRTAHCSECWCLHLRPPSRAFQGLKAALTQSPLAWTRASVSGQQHWLVWTASVAQPAEDFFCGLPLWPTLRHRDSLYLHLCPLVPAAVRQPAPYPPPSRRATRWCRGGPAVPQSGRRCERAGSRPSVRFHFSFGLCQLSEKIRLQRRNSDGFGADCTMLP